MTYLEETLAEALHNINCCKAAGRGPRDEDVEQAKKMAAWLRERGWFLGRVADEGDGGDGI